MEVVWLVGGDDGHQMIVVMEVGLTWGLVYPSNQMISEAVDFYQNIKI